ncbi:hypothetical protein ACOSQ3_013889 [Xanthoceras sorbifolium]
MGPTSKTQTHHHDPNVLQRRIRLYSLHNPRHRPPDLRRRLHTPILQLPPVRPLPLHAVSEPRRRLRPAPPSPRTLQVLPLRQLRRLLRSLSRHRQESRLQPLREVQLDAGRHSGRPPRGAAPPDPDPKPGSGRNRVPGHGLGTQCGFCVQLFLFSLWVGEFSSG